MTGTRVSSNLGTGGGFISSPIGGGPSLGGIPMDTKSDKEKAAERLAAPVVPTAADAKRSPALAKAKALEAAAVSKNAARKAAGQKRR